VGKWMRMAFVSSFVAAAVLTYSCGQSGNPFISKSGRGPWAKLREAWDAANDPGLMLGVPKTLTELLSQRFLSGESLPPWSDSYWPLQSAGIAERWIDPESFPAFDIAGDPRTESEEAYFSASEKSIEAAVADAANSAAAGWEKSWGISPAEKYDIAAGNADFDLTRSELEAFSSNRWTYEKDDIPWGWMGHCHGWSLASIALPAPRHAVLAHNRRTGQSVLLTEGDIRALLTKIASDNGTSEPNRFAGTRCEDEDSDIPRDHNQRIVDAGLGIWDEQGHSLVRDKRVAFRAIFHSRFDGGNESGLPWAVLQRIGAADDAPGNDVSSGNRIADLIWVDGVDWMDWQRKVVAPVVYSVRAAEDNASGGNIRPDMVLWAADAKLIGRSRRADGEWEVNADGAIVVRRDEADAKWRKVAGSRVANAASATPKKFAFKSYKECRDINPATFHTALVSWLGGRRPNNADTGPRGFVIDLTRTEQVWNQGLWRYASRAGNPTALQVSSGGQTIKDPYAMVRASGTKQIVDFVTTVSFGVENGPYVSFSEEDEISRDAVFRYTLEFGEDGKLLGGEWHSTGYENTEPLSGEALLRDLNNQVGRSYHSWEGAPDFIWGVPASAGNSLEFRDSAFLKASVIAAIHKCSLAQAGDGNLPEVSLPISGAPPVRLKYVPCEID
jgi:hypothetical protein